MLIRPSTQGHGVPGVPWAHHAVVEGRHFAPGDSRGAGRPPQTECVVREQPGIGRAPPPAGTGDPMNAILWMTLGGSALATLVVGSVPAGEARIQVGRAGDAVELSWTGPGVLEEAPAVDGLWAEVAGAASPCRRVAAQGAQFFRVRVEVSLRVRLAGEGQGTVRSQPAGTTTGSRRSGRTPNLRPGEGRSPGWSRRPQASGP